VTRLIAWLAFPPLWFVLLVAVVSVVGVLWLWWRLLS
jgi:phosphate/sulfate permease|tara:strand:- start:62 stop:172 length:111 start_codon:yes stop_codon:yes gene_type:complete